jgi:hypothetical protein
MFFAITIKSPFFSSPKLIPPFCRYLLILVVLFLLIFETTFIFEIQYISIYNSTMERRMNFLNASKITRQIKESHNYRFAYFIASIKQYDCLIIGPYQFSNLRILSI